MSLMPAGSSPLVGSSMISKGGRPSIAAAMPEPLAHALGVSLDLPGRHIGHRWPARTRATSPGPQPPPVAPSTSRLTRPVIHG